MAEDEELQREVRRAAHAERKPWWFAGATLALIVGGAFVTQIATQRLGAHPNAAPLFGLAAGFLVSIAVLGHSPGMYRDRRTGQYSLFWSARTRRGRAICVLGASLLVLLGVAIDLWA